MFHEYVHKIYRYVLHGNECLWLEEGLAVYFSGQKGFLEVDEQKYNNFISRIKNYEVPKLEYLKTQGMHYGEFCDLETNKYNGYDISYFIIRELLDKKDTIFLKKL